MRIPSMCCPTLLRPPLVLSGVHFWCLFPDEVQDMGLLRTYEELLSPEEQEELAGARTETLHKGRILARTLVRTTLARYTESHVDPKSLRFRKNKFGKPEVIWPKLTAEGNLWHPPALCFNLSHTRSLIACGVTLNRAVGIDVEEKKRKTTLDVMALAHHKFSKKEAAWLQSLTDSEERQQHFLHLWTLKESYVKAVGKGISGIPFKEFSFDLKASSSAYEQLKKVIDIPAVAKARSINLDLVGTVLEQEIPSELWKFLLFEPSSAHVASICVQHADDVKDPTNNFQVQAWKTTPLASDEPLHSGATGLAVSNDS